MRWRRFIRILQNHPYLLDSAFQMSVAQAERIQAKDGYPSFEEMVRRAKQKSSAPAAAWAPVDAVIARNKKTGVHGLWNMLCSRPIRGWAIACLCAILLGCYLTLAPSGRALAYHVAKIVMQVLDKGFSFTPTSNEVVLIQESDPVVIDTPENVIDFESVRLEVGSPILYLQNEMFCLDNFELYDNDLTGKHLISTYIAASGQFIELQQRWSIRTENWLQINDDDIVWEDFLQDGTTLYCFIDPMDSTFNATAVWQDSILWIYAEKGILPQEVIHSIRISE